MADGIKLYTLGQLGVIIDPNPLSPSLPVDSLRNAQNATHDPRRGRGGALVKRQGLIQFNINSAGGAILGGIAMPVAGTGGAPVVAASAGFPGFTGDTSTGTAAGAGSQVTAAGTVTLGTGAPGNTTGGAPRYGSGGAAGFNGGATLFNGARLVNIGFIDNTDSNAGGEGWFVTSAGVNNSASIAPAGATAPGVIYSFPPTTVFPTVVGLPCAFYGVNGYFYYANAHTQHTSASTNFVGSGTTTSGTVSSATGLVIGGIVSITTGGVAYVVTLNQVNGTALTWAPPLPAPIAGGETLNLLETRPGIYKTNGQTTTLVTTIPRVPGTSANANSNTVVEQRAAVTMMHWGYDGNIYVCVKDKADGQNTAGNYGRVFKMDANGGLTDINLVSVSSNNPSGLGLTTMIPYTCALFDNKLFVGEFDLASSELQTSGNIIMDVIAGDFKSYVPFGFTVSGSGGVTSMLPFPSRVPPGQNWTDAQMIANRVLFVGLATKKAAAPPTANLWYRTRDNQNVGTIVVLANPGLGDQGVAADGNYWVSLVDFNGKLYASYFNPSTKSNIYQYTPTFSSVSANGSADGYWDGTGTWANVLSGTNTYAYYLFTDQNFIYAIGLQSLSTGTPKVYSSPDGTNWTDQSANLPAGAHARISTPFLFGVNQ